MPSFRKRSRTVLAIAGVAVAAAPCAAAAQEFGFTRRAYMSTIAAEELRPRYDADDDGTSEGRDTSHLGGRVGPYLVLPELSVRGVYDDNIDDSPVDPISEYALEVDGRLMLRSELPRHMLNILLEGRYTGYESHDEQNRLAGGAEAEWRLDVDAGDAFGGRVKISHGQESRFEPDSPLAAATPVTERTNEADFAFTHDAGAPLSGTIGLSARNDDFTDVAARDGSTIDQDFRDRTSYGTYLNLNYRFSPGYSAIAVLEAGREEYAEVASASLDAANVSAQAGLDFELTRLVRASILGGYGVKDFDSDSSADLRSFIYRGRIDWSLTQQMSLSFNAGREIATPATGGGGRVDTNVGANLGLEVTRDLKLTGTLDYLIADLTDGSRTDEVITVGVGGEYGLGKNLIFTFDYQHRSRDSSDDAYDLEDNRAMVGVTARF